jgi:hypothetical protein
MTNKLIYSEKVTSSKTTLLFVLLTLFFFYLMSLSINVLQNGFLAGLSRFLVVIFLFYTLNYHKLVIRITQTSLRLNFGLFRWTVPLDNIESCRLDELAPVQKYGGAGIHFMTVNQRYRASFNFIEHPRVVVALKRKAGPVRDLSFSTRRPEEVIQGLNDAISS